MRLTRRGSGGLFGSKSGSEAESLIAQHGSGGKLTLDQLIKAIGTPHGRQPTRARIANLMGKFVPC